MSKFSERLRSDKKLFLIVSVCIVGLALLVLSEFIPDKDENVTEDLIVNENVNFNSYEKELENRLKVLLESIKDAGKVQVMITVESGDEKIYATESNTDNENEERKYVLLDVDGTDNGLLLKVAQPKVRGVAVVCQGADLPAVREEITGAVTSVLGISTNRVNISKMKS